LIWLGRVLALIIVLLIANLAAAFKWQEFQSDIKLDWSELLELGFHGAGTVIWFIAIGVSALAFLPAVIAVIVAQRRQIASPWTFAYAGAAINSGAYYILKAIVMWTLGPGVYPHPVLEFLCMAGAGLLAGVVYWLLAGRKPRRAPTTA
jgi:hypothetical protein